MSTHKHIDKICCVILCLALIITVAFMNGEKLGIKKASTVMGYENKIFDTSRVHQLNIVMDDWDTFVSNCKNEEYYNCTVVIDNEAYKNVAIRGKGNTSLTQVDSYGNNRYSFKIEFDHYDSSKNYYGLDKLCLNNIIQDNTYMKDYLCYQMMSKAGVASPLCSYVYITVNGEDWGLYLAVEGVEESFLQRNYGKNYGELYKPDSQNMGGGRGNGEGFDMDNFLDNADLSNNSDLENDNSQGNSAENSFNGLGDRMPEQNGGFTGDMPSGAVNTPGGMTPPDLDENFAGGENADFDKDVLPDDVKEKIGGGMTNGSDDVLLKYIDDNVESYSNIFDNAKTDVTDSDKTRLIESLKNLSNQEDIENTVDIEAVINYFVVHNFVLNFDSYTGSMIHNYYLYENDGQMQMIPWDYNLAFGGFNSSDDATSLINYPIDEPVSDGNVENRPMLAWIFSNEEYTELYHNRFAEFISEYFESGYFEEMISSVEEMISPYVEKDVTKFCTYDEFKTGISTLKEFCLLRADSIAAQLDGAIGTTNATQNSDTLIDGGDMVISDMGSMNNSMGVGDKGDFLNKPDAAVTEPEEVETTENNENSNAEIMGGGNIQNGTVPDLSDGQPPQTPNGKNFGNGNFEGQGQNFGDTDFNGQAPNFKNETGDIPAKPDDMGENAELPENNAENNIGDSSQENQNADDTSDNALTKPDNIGGNAGEPNDKGLSGSTSKSGTNSVNILVLLVVSVIVLGGGILFEKRFK